MGVPVEKLNEAQKIAVKGNSCRILGKKQGIFQRTLNNLVSEGILESEYRANARYFKVNKNYPLYKELKSIVFKTVGVSGSLKNLKAAEANLEIGEGLKCL